MTKILAIDVGIKNLGMACMSSKDGIYQIHYMENIDMIETTGRCKIITKKGTVCNSICTLTIVHPEATPSFLCKRHGADKVVKRKSITTIPLKELALIVLKKIEFIYLQNRALFDEIHTIVIEKQPKMNPKMGLVSNLIFGKLCELTNCKVIKFITARSKARLLCEYTDLKGKKSYSNRKNAAIDYCLKLLNSGKVQDSELWLEKLKESTRMSDICDCMMYCIVVGPS
jgi:hypothetical protein